MRKENLEDVSKYDLCLCKTEGRESESDGSERKQDLKI